MLRKRTPMRYEELFVEPEKQMFRYELTRRETYYLAFLVECVLLAKRQGSYNYLGAIHKIAQEHWTPIKVLGKRRARITRNITRIYILLAWKLGLVKCKKGYSKKSGYSSFLITPTMEGTRFVKRHKDLIGDRFKEDSD